MVSSDRGLCGAYNANGSMLPLDNLREQKAAGVDTVVETVGKKAVAFQFRHRDRQPLRTGRQAGI